jgi:hypothetical protein
MWQGVGMADSGELLAAKFGAIFPHLDERQRRLADLDPVEVSAALTGRR